MPGRGRIENSYGAVAFPVWHGASYALHIGELDELAFAVDGTMLHREGAQTGGSRVGVGCVLDRHLGRFLDPVDALSVRLAVEGRPPGGRLVVGLELDLVVVGVAFVATAGAADVAVRLGGGAGIATVTAGCQLLNEVGLRGLAVSCGPRGVKRGRNGPWSSLSSVLSHR